MDDRWERDDVSIRRYFPRNRQNELVFSRRYENRYVLFLINVKFSISTCEIVETVGWRGFGTGGDSREWYTAGDVLEKTSKSWHDCSEPNALHQSLRGCCMVVLLSRLRVHHTR